MDLPNRGNILQVPADLHKAADGRIGGTVQFRRFHLGRNGAAHGGAVAMLFDSLLGYTAFRLSRSRAQRTAYLHIDYRKIAPVEKELQVEAGFDGIEESKDFVSRRIPGGGGVGAGAQGLFGKAKAGPPGRRTSRTNRTSAAGGRGGAT